MRLKKVWIYISAFIISGLLISLILKSSNNDFGDVLGVGYFYSFNLVLALWLAQRYMVNKFDVFKGFEAWILRTFLYIIAVSFAYTAGFTFQNFLLTHHANLDSFIITGGIELLVYVVSIPFSNKSITDLFNPEMRDLLYSFFSIIFIIGIISMIASYIEIRWRTEKQRHLLLNAELKAWRTQIEPHFLFNSLNTIVSIVKKDPDQAENLLIKLSDLLRFHFNQSHVDLIAVKDEIAFIQNYLEMMKARYPKNLVVNIEIDLKNRNMKIPPLILQPVVENAIRHGWSDKNESFELKITLIENDQGMNIKVRDNGIGIEQNHLERIPQEGHALDNLNQRLELLYSKSNLLKFRSESGEFTEVEIRIPEKRI